MNRRRSALPRPKPPVGAHESQDGHHLLATNAAKIKPKAGAGSSAPAPPPSIEPGWSFSVEKAQVDFPLDQAICSCTRRPRTEATENQVANLAT
jgi:hypothetical protein